MLTPTAEQAACIDTFNNGDTMIIEALAGTGKTTSLKMIADGTRRKGLYAAFNKSVVTDAKAVMPQNVKVSTFHSLAYGAVGWRYKKRLGGSRVRSERIAAAFGINPITFVLPGGERRLAAGFLGGHMLKALNIFCTTDDDEPSVMHFPLIDGLDMLGADGQRRYDNNNAVAAALLPALKSAWADVQSPDSGLVPFQHGMYLKMWALTRPVLPYDFVMIDEAQDLAPVVAGVIDNQDANTQLCLVGDPNQSIYAFTGAVDAMARMGIENRSFLTESWRFGPEIANQANVLLALLDAESRLKGRGGPGRVGKVEQPHAILSRTNALCVRAALNELKRGGRPAIVGGADEVIRFAKAAEQLEATGFTSHPELACFKSWTDVQEYVSQDANGSDLALLVSLIDEFGAEAIIDGLSQCVSEASATLILSTAHKSKGRQWPTVRLADDFPKGVDDDGCVVPVADEELRLLYVAATRAESVLDHGGNPIMYRRESETEGMLV